MTARLAVIDSIELRCLPYTRLMRFESGLPCGAPKPGRSNNPLASTFFKAAVAADSPRTEPKE